MKPIPPNTDLDFLAIKDNSPELIDEKPKTPTQPKFKRLDGGYFVDGCWRFKINLSKKDGSKWLTFHGLYIEGVFRELESYGFYKRRGEGQPGSEFNESPFFIQAKGCIIEPVEIGYMLDTFRERYISNVKDVNINYQGVEQRFTAEALTEKFNQQFNNVFNEKTLRGLPIHDKPILKDTPESAFFFFRNGIIEVRANGLNLMGYNSVTDKAIWRGRMIPHDYKAKAEPNGHWERFIKNVSVAESQPERFNSFRSAIGYLLHNYYSSSMGQAVLCYDEKPARKGSPEGGSGKGLFVKGLQNLRRTDVIDGKAIKPDDKFMWQQITRQTQIVSIDDPKETFQFDSLFSALTEGWSIEYKHQPKIYIPPEDCPKVCIPSNTAITREGTSNKRRQFIIEFSDYYSKRIIDGTEEPIKNEHGRIFFGRTDNDNWSAKDWQQFFSFQLACVGYYLAIGLKGYKTRNVELNQLLQGTNEDFVEWIQAKKIKPDTPYNKQVYFEDFKKTYYGDESKLQQKTFTGWLKKWAGLYGYIFEQPRSNGVSYFQIRLKSV